MNAGSLQKERSPRWERRDASGPALLRFVLSLILGALMVHVGVGIFYSNLKAAGESASFPAEAPVVRWNSVPKPRLEIAGDATEPLSPPNSYAWVDRQNGVVRIPIDRAIELFARGIITNETRK